MTSGSAKEMRRMLEEIKIYARCAKESGHLNDLECSATINLIEQKLTTSIVRDFRRWLYRDHKAKQPSVDLLITFLTKETELQERLNQICSNNTPSKPKFVNVGKVIRPIHKLYAENHKGRILPSIEEIYDKY